MPMPDRFLNYLDGLKPPERSQLIGALSPEEVESAGIHWPSWAHEGQLAPDGGWDAWVIVAGRGFGKTRAGAEWIAAAARGNGQLRIALVAASIDEARRVMIEGESGLLAIAKGEVADWNPTRKRLCFVSGAEATLYSGAQPEGLRGPEHHLAWCDELAKWQHPQATWDMLRLGLRLGAHPRVLVTTTPRPGEALRRIMVAPGSIVTGGGTAANPHLPKAFLDAVTAMYAGTRLGRQELEGELLPDAAGALWTVELIERCRPGATTHNHHPSEGRDPSRPLMADAPPPDRHPGEGRDPVPDVVLDPGLRRDDGEREGILPPPTFRRTVIGVDPPAGDGTCGIVACAVDEAGIAHVLADHSVTGRSPDGWASAVAAAAKVHGATLVVAEANQGGKMVESVLRAAGVKARVRLVRATEGKSARADPIATLFEKGSVRLHGRFPELEAQLCGLIAGGGYEGPGTSPDRADAMVWALTELMLGKERAALKVWVG